MSNIRVGEKICNLSRVTRGQPQSSETWHQLPISRLLQVERHRGFDFDRDCEHDSVHAHTHDHVPVNIKSSNLQQNVTTSKHNIRYIVNATGPLTPPRPIVALTTRLTRQPRETDTRRSLSTSSCNHFPSLPLSKGSPRAPVRAPASVPRFVPRPSEPEPEFSDILSATGVAIERQRQEKLQYELGQEVYVQRLSEDQRQKEDLEKERERDMIRTWVTQWRAKLHHVESQMTHMGLDLVPPPIQDIIDDIQMEARLTGSQRWLQYTYQRMWETHWAKYWKSICTQVDQSADILHQLRLQARDLEYRFHWWRWRADLLRFEVDEATKTTHALKSEKGHHQLLNLALAGISSASQALADNINCDSAKFLSRMLLARKKNPESAALAYRILKMWSIFHIFANNIGVRGHVWRVFNRLQQEQLRFPEVVQSQLVSTKIDYSIGLAFSALFEMSTILQSLTKRHTASWRTLRGNLGPLISTVAAQVHWLAHFRIELLRLLSRDSALSCIPQSFPFALQWRALLSPFVIAELLQADTDAAVLKVRDFYNDCQDSGALTSAQRQLFEFCQRFVAPSIRHVRDCYDLRRQYTYPALAALLAGEKINVPMTRIWDEASESKRQVKHHRTLRALSSRYDIYDPAKQNMGSNDRLFRFHASDNLYPTNTGFPVEYVFSMQRTIEVLKIVRHSKVVGIHLLPAETMGKNRRPVSLGYLTFATIDRVYICEARSELFNALFVPQEFQDLLQDPNVLKICFDYSKFKKLASPRLISPQGIVDINYGAVPIWALSKSDLHRSHALLTASVNQRGFQWVVNQLALLPVYNLVTFLTRIERRHLRNLSPSMTQSILEAREDLLAKLSTRKVGGLGFGPLVWDRGDRLKSTGLPASFAQSMQPKDQKKESTRLIQLVKAMASYTIKNWNTVTCPVDRELLENEHTHSQLTAYYLFTTLAKDFNSIKTMLDLKGSAAEAILSISKTLKLRLNDDHQHMLKQVGCVTYYVKYHLNATELDTTTGPGSDVEQKDSIQHNVKKPILRHPHAQMKEISGKHAISLGFRSKISGRKRHDKGAINHGPRQKSLRNVKRVNKSMSRKKGGANH